MSKKSSGSGKPKLFDTPECKNCAYKGSRYCWNQCSYNIWRKLRIQRDFAYIPYNTVNRRVRALEEHGYIEKSK